jgi:hypothetical protein
VTGPTHRIMLPPSEGIDRAKIAFSTWPSATSAVSIEVNSHRFVVRYLDYFFLDSQMAALSELILSFPQQACVRTANSSGNATLNFAKQVRYSTIK